MVVDYSAGSGNSTYTYTGKLPYPSMICFFNDSTGNATVAVNDVPAITVKAGEQLVENFEQFDTVAIVSGGAWRMIVAR